MTVEVSPNPEALEAAAARLIERQATVHKRVACPRCGAQRGYRCFDLRTHIFRHAKHPHVERLRADGIPPR